MKKTTRTDNGSCSANSCSCHEPVTTNRDVSTSWIDFHKHWKPVVSLVLLLSGLSFDYLFTSPWFIESVRLFWYGTAYLPVGLPVLRQAFTHLMKGDVVTEFFLMGIATLGAFYIGEYPEGVAVMLFYAVGEAFQQKAISKARQNIRSLLDVRSETAHVNRDGRWATVHPKSVQTGEIIQVRPGDQVPLDGNLITDHASFDTSAITGESKPRNFSNKDKVLAGMINLNRVIELEVTATYENSSISRILELVQNATSRKAKTELFIRLFARVYTPIVVFLAALLVIVPAFFASPYVFQDWLYRSLVFLVISCPCALVISIPLGYFGGIGAASRNGILVKGSNFLDALQKVTTVVFDKTGTLTRGTFTVQRVDSVNGSGDELLALVQAMEKQSTHPIARAIEAYIENPENGVSAGRQSSPRHDVKNQMEIPGLGLQATVDGKTVLLGSQPLMEKHGIAVNGDTAHEPGSVVHIAIDHVYEGSILISDEIKEDAKQAVDDLRKLGVRNTAILSGDKLSVAEVVGRKLNIDHVYAGLLPEEKAAKLEELKQRFPGIMAYAGDGINDGPVLAMSDVGIAMGAMGSDVAIETADVVIQTDQPSKITTAIVIGRATRNIVWQNIGLALGIKVLFLGLGALGLATLWEAVFADVGVALLAILNAIRIQKMKFN
ncbi:MAG: heavy metal translocating P-type ATPase [Candidatus Paceibacterota bacterium]